MIETFKTYRPTITLENNSTYNITINPKLRRYLVNNKNLNNKIFINKNNIWEILKLCKHYKETNLFKTIFNELKFYSHDIPYIIEYKENYGCMVTWK